ncbi:MAG: sigma-70 family RNA polymerase sigma factor [Nannocystaceae bacterium]|nr:sigma-70 family RNA polymerase sigma factor [bacterium]
MQSFESLYRQHYGFVWATVRRHGVASMLVEDAVHDTFVVAYRRLEAFDGRRPKAWLYSIGRRVASSYRRTEGRRAARHVSAAEVPRAQRDVESTVGAKTALDRFLDTLSPDDRELFVLSEVDGLTGPELAATLGRKLPTLYSRVRVLRQRFERNVGGEVRESRPAASARGWMLLQPLIATPASGTPLVLGGAVALGLACAGVIGVAQMQPAAPPPVASIPLPPVRASLTPAASAPTQVPAPAVIETPPEPDPARAAPQTRRPRPGPKPRVHDLAADTRLLREAKAALRRGDAPRAQALLREHEGTFREPAQPDVRTVLWVETLCALGRETDARTRMDALLSARPGSPVAARLGSSCAGQGKSAAQP